MAPMNLSDYQLSVLGYAGVAAIGAIGLNLLTGYTGQVSLGHGFFIAVGSYTTAYFGSAYATTLSPAFDPNHRWWPVTITTYCRPPAS